MRVLFWNTHNNDINQTICDIIWENKINIAILAEYNASVSNLLDRLSANSVPMKQYLSAGCEKIILLGNIDNIQPGFQSNRFSIQIVAEKLIICAAHLPSSIYGESSGRRRIVIQSIVKEIERTESELNTKYSIIVGDMNEDPYDDGCLSADNFHGLPCKTDALRESRIIEGKSFSMFYNPMWNFFGDFSSPPGTYYYDGSSIRNSFWHIYDQVLVRPCLLKDRFDERSLRIVTQSGIDSLLDERAHPNKKFSDHLPIIFEIKESEKE